MANTPDGTPYEDVAQKMANESLDYFCMEGYGASYGDPELERLCEDAAKSLRAVETYMENITLPVIEKYAMELYATVSRVKGEEVTPEMEAEGERYIKGFTKAPSLF